MDSKNNCEEISGWQLWVGKFEKFVLASVALLLVIIVTTILAVVIYLFVTKVGAVVYSVDSGADLQRAALRGFSGVLLVLLGLELLDTVKVYSREHSVRVEVILLVGLIAMGRHVLEIDLHHIDPLTMFGFSSLILVLAISYFLVKRAPLPTIGFKGQARSDTGESLTEK